MSYASILARCALALGLACTVAACSSTRSSTSPSASAPPPSDRRAEARPGGDVSDLEALYWARQDSARADFTKADVRFMTMMISHHAQALVMSSMAPTHGASEAVQTLAARIINAQRDEIAIMQQWLRRRGQRVPEVEIDGLELRVGGMKVHGMDMVGVLTQEQIDELDAARGADFDRLFLRYMIEHHSGAVSMVDTLFATDGAAQDDDAFKLASSIHVDQETEIARMRQMLRAISGNAPDSK
jgi:uncharacterized protein (DUF305 family)